MEDKYLKSLVMKSLREILFEDLKMKLYLIKRINWPEPSFKSTIRLQF